LFYLTPEGQDTRVSKAKFEIGRNFCTKLWNAARLVMQNLGGFQADVPAFERGPEAVSPEDRWILSRLEATTRDATRALDEFRVNAALQALYDFTWGDLCDWWLEIAKPRLYAADEASRRPAQAVAAHALERVLRLLHPFIPFVTEELWRRLHAACGFAGDASIMVAPWPAGDEGRIDAGVEARFALLTGLVREARNIRAHYGIPPGRAISAQVTGAAESLATVREGRELISRLAKLDGLAIETGLKKPKGSAFAVVRDLEVHVPLAGLIDIEVEKKRVQERLASAEQSLAGTRAKLAAAGFSDRAPPEVVAKTRATEAELAAQVASLRASLQDLE
ncbi:MAG: class I tRNA ligase family protein, partial [Polyangiaceae bacterium]